MGELGGRGGGIGGEGKGDGKCEEGLYSQGGRGGAPRAGGEPAIGIVNGEQDALGRSNVTGEIGAANANVVDTRCLKDGSSRTRQQQRYIHGAHAKGGWRHRKQIVEGTAVDLEFRGGDVAAARIGHSGGAGWTGSWLNPRRRWARG